MSEYEDLLDKTDGYDKPREVKHVLHEDGQMGKVIDHLSPDEAAEYTRLRIAQTKVDEGGMGAVKQRHGGIPLMEATIAEMRANLYGGG